MTIAVTAHARRGQRTSQSCRGPTTRLVRRRARQRGRVAWADAASINAQPVDGKSLGIASHVVAPPHGRTCGCRRTVAGHPDPWLVA
jgi:hypothetical protein